MVSSEFFESSVEIEDSLRWHNRNGSSKKIFIQISLDPLVLLLAAWNENIGDNLKPSMLKNTFFGSQKTGEANKLKST